MLNQYLVIHCAIIKLVIIKSIERLATRFDYDLRVCVGMFIAHILCKILLWPIHRLHMRFDHELMHSAGN